MARPPLEVRRAELDDVDAVVALWSQARPGSRRAGRPIGTTAEQVGQRLRAALGGDQVEVLLATWSGSPAGYLLLRTAPITVFLDSPAVQIEHLFVVPALRRHGVARALLSAAAGIAERRSADQVLVSVPAAARDAHRFFARLGFAPFTVRRVVSTASLRRNLAGETRRAGLDALLSRRRSQRARAAAALSEPLPETASPETAGPETAGPEVAGPEVAGPEVAGPETARPQPAGPVSSPAAQLPGAAGR